MDSDDASGSSARDNTSTSTTTSSTTTADAEPFSDPEQEIPSNTNSVEEQEQPHQDDVRQEQQQQEPLLSPNTTPTATPSPTSTTTNTNTLRQLANFAMTASAAAATATASAISNTSLLSSSSSPSPSSPPSPSSSYPTLARSESIPSWAKVLLPFLCVACQILFYYGQTEPMWKLHVNAEVDVWANATEYTARRTFDVLGLDYDIPISVDVQKDVQTFTYMFAIKELWKAKDLPGTFLPRSAAVLLIIFSGIWPHLKLIMLNLTWFFGKHKTRRTKTLAWLAALGKWSLADVLVVCVMVGVLNLDWVVDPGAIKDGLINDLPSILQIAEGLYTTEQVCDKLLKMDCVTQKRVAKIAKCKACKGLVGEAFGHPEWAKSTGRKILDGVSTNGGGMATLRVVGMNGIYYFCGAVILSIFLSLVVDIFDHRAKIYERKREEEATRGGVERGYRERGGLLLGERPVRRLISERGASGNNSNSNNNNNNGMLAIGIDNDDNRLDTPLLLGDNGASAIPSASSSLEIELPEGFDDEAALSSNHPSNNNNNNTIFNGSSRRQKLFSIWFLIAALFTAVVVCLAAEMSTMERLVFGAGPKLLHDILGVDWERPYSFQTLMWTTGAAGGWDYMLMGTFGLFCVVGPVVRVILLFFIVLLDQCHISFTNMAVIVNFLGSFCAWEVFAIATVMVQMLMPSITDTIIRNPACGSISDDGSCLKIEFNLVPIAFSMVLIGGTSMVGLSWIATGRAMAMIDNDKEYGAVRTTTGNDNSNGNGNGSGSGNHDSNTTNGRGISALARVMRRNHDYERLQGIEEGTGTGSSTGGELEELVFETNQV